MKKNKWIWTLWVGISLCILSVFVVTFWHEQKMQKEIARQILRFHVLADSNSQDDQDEKMQVKNAVAAYLQPILTNMNSKEETIECVENQLYNIEEIARKIVISKNVKVSLEEDWFPTITYGECTFPAGVYDTLRVQIGEAKGHNWWCVLYPGLCFSSAVQPVVTDEDKNLLKSVLDEECYNFLLRPVKTKIRFRLFGLELFG